MHLSIVTPLPVHRVIGLAVSESRYIWLAAAGWRVVVLERKTFLSEKLSGAPSQAEVSLRSHPRTMHAGPLLVAAACAFSPPTTRLGAPLSAVRPHHAPIVYMAGWNDPYQEQARAGKSERLNLGSGSSFEDQMQARAG